MERLAFPGVLHGYICSGEAEAYHMVSTLFTMSHAVLPAVRWFSSCAHAQRGCTRIPSRGIDGVRPCVRARVMGRACWRRAGVGTNEETGGCCPPTL